MAQRNNYASPKYVIIKFELEDVITTSAGVDPGHQDFYDVGLLNAFETGGAGQ